MWRKLAALLALMLLGVGIASVLGYRWLHSPLAVGDDYVYTLPQGSSLSRLSRDLDRQDILSYPRLWVLYARVSGEDTIKAGEYRLTPEDTPATLLGKLRRGDVVTYPVTLVEGWTFQDALNYLQSQPKITPVLTDDEALEKFLAKLQLPGDHPEGWFFPDTYRYVAGSSDRDILFRAHDRMRDVLASEWQHRAGSLPYESRYEALIMASIVERETGVAEERGQIAGVFVRRLEQNMRLQTDPTVIYGLADDYDGNIGRQHLAEMTPYNTYRINGLPPTPIALPGREAIRAALQPEPGDALFFVAKGDGSHYFSATLEEHNRAVQKFQVRQRADEYRSAPEVPTLEQESDQAE